MVHYRMLINREQADLSIIEAQRGCTLGYKKTIP